MSNKLYDVLKYICQIALPALLTCAASILGLCGVAPETIAMVVGIGTAVDTLLGALLGISSAKYNKTHEAEEIEDEGEETE